MVKAGMSPSSVFQSRAVIGFGPGRIHDRPWPEDLV
jgi:hypothetical protein